MTIIETGEPQPTRYKMKLRDYDYLSALLGLLVLVGLVIIGYKIGEVL